MLENQLWIVEADCESRGDVALSASTCSEL